MNVSEVWPSRYVKAADLNGKTVTLTIKELRLEELGHGNEREQKAVLYFERATKCMVVNKTNGMIIAKLHGNETDLWAGKRIAIYGTRVRAFGSVHEVIRVREEIPPAPKPAAVEEASEIDDENDVTDSDEAYTDRTIDPAPAADLANDVNLWEPDTGPERATQDQLDQLDALGKAFYGDAWEAKLPKLVAGVTTGATTAAAQLSPAEAERLITGIRNKQAAAVQSTNGAKAVANGAVAK